MSIFNDLYHGDPQTIFDTLETADLSGHNLGAALSGLARQLVRIETHYKAEIERLEERVMYLEAGGG